MKNFKWIHFAYIFTFIFRLFFALNVGLIDDEAYHWSWAKELQLSYFDHPGLIAWAEALSTFLFGDTLLGVRLPAMVFYGLTAWVLWKMTQELFNAWSAHFVTFVFLWSPFYGFGGHVASPEPPFIFFWITSAWIFWQGVREDSQKWSLKKTWLWLGVTMGLGINSKFIIVLLAPGFALYMLLTQQHRKDLFKPWPWSGALLASITALPVFVWNISNEWPSFKYQFHDRHAHTEPSLSRWLEFFGAQFLFYSPFLYLLILFALFYAALNLQKTQWRFIFSLSIPSFLIFYPQPIFAEYKPHWTGAAVLILLMGVSSLLSQKNFPYRRFWLGSTVFFFLFFSVITYGPFVHPWVPKLYRWTQTWSSNLAQTPWNPRNDLSNEFFGWKQFGEHLHYLSNTFKDKPFLSSHRYETTAQTYWGANEKTYMLGTPVSHYTVSQRKNGIEDLLGKNTLFVSTDKYSEAPENQAYFESCQKLPDFRTYREDEHARTFFIYYCKNFQGIKNQ